MRQIEKRMKQKSLTEKQKPQGTYRNHFRNGNRCLRRRNLLVDSNLCRYMVNMHSSTLPNKIENVSILSCFAISGEQKRYLSEKAWFYQAFLLSKSRKFQSVFRRCFLILCRVELPYTFLRQNISVYSSVRCICINFYRHFRQKSIEHIESVNKKIIGECL